MTFEAYLDYFNQIVDRPDDKQSAPYNDPMYIDYTRLNWSRMQRWLKTGVLTAELKAAMSGIGSAREWIIITEPWCGDAAHIVPFLHMAGLLNPLITVRYELRDREPFLINSYLTNNTKSIPKLIVRDGTGKDLATWGPRPAACQEVYQSLLQEKADFETIKTVLQQWYNKDKGQAIQAELAILLSPEA